MNDDLRQRVMDVIEHLRGSSTGVMQGFDEAIEDGLISQEEWQQNEEAICNLVDNEIFECSGCGWTLNVDEMGEDTDGGEIQCKNCEEE